MSEEINFNESNLIDYDNNISNQEQTLESKFSENFWDDKLNGYFVLYQNLRNSQTSIKELEVYLREYVSCEEQYVRQLNKCSSQLSKFQIDSTISPFWSNIIKEINERNSAVHMNLVHRLYELIKDVQVYSEDFRKRKKKIKENAIQTASLLEAFRNIKQVLVKSKDQYLQVKIELDRNQKLIEYTQTNQNVGAQKLERKTQLAVEEYKQSVDKYNSIRLEFVEKYTEMCNQFQQFEESHLKQMQDFISAYIKLLNSLNQSRNKFLIESQQKMNSYSINHLINQFISNKSTGKDRPSPVELLDLNNSILSTGNTGASFFSSSNILNKKRSLTNPVDYFATPNITQEPLQEVDPDLNRKRSDSRMLNFFNMDFLSRLKNKKENNQPNLNLNNQPKKTILETQNEAVLIPNLDDFQLSKSETAPALGINDKTATNISINTENDAAKTKTFYTKVINKARIRKLRLNSEPTLDAPSNPINNSFDENKSSSSLGKIIDDDKEEPSSTFLKTNSLDDENFKKVHDSDLDPEFHGLEKLDSSNKDQADMTNLYESSDDAEDFKDIQNKAWSVKRANETDYDRDRDEHDSDSDDNGDSDDSDAPKRIVLRIKPIAEIDRNNTASPDVLNMISKNLQLKTTSTPKRKAYLKSYKLNSNLVLETESMTSLSSAVNPNLISTSPSLSSVIPPQRPMSTISFDSKIDENNNYITQNNLISTQQKPIPPPLPPLPSTLQLKINKRLNAINEHKLDNKRSSINSNINSPQTPPQTPVTPALSILPNKPSISVITPSIESSSFENSNLKTIYSRPRPQSPSSSKLRQSIPLNIKMPDEEEMKF